MISLTVQYYRRGAYEKVYCRNCNLLYTAFYVLHFTAICRANRWYGNGCFDPIGNIDTVNLTWQYFQKQNKILLSGSNGSGLFAICISLLQWNSIYACNLVFCCIGSWHVGWNGHI